MQSVRSETTRQVLVGVSKRYPEVLIMIILVLFCVRGSTAEQVRVTFEHTLPVLLLSLANLVVMITGRIDLSLTSLMAISAVLFVVLSEPVPGVLSALLVLMIIFILAFTYGTAIAYLNANSLSFTLGLMFAFQYSLYAVAGHQEVTRIEALSFMSAVGSVPGQVIVATTCVGGLAVLVHYSRLGMWMRAAGSNEPTFRALAVRPRMVIGLAFATGAALAALAGIVESARSEHGDPAANPELLLSGILAALIGGVKLSGGEGTVWYAVRGGLLFALIKEHLEQVGLDPEIRWVLLGVLVVLASLSEFFRRRLIDDRKIL